MATLEQGAAAVQRLAMRVQGLAEPPEGTMEAVLERGRQIIIERTTGGHDMAGNQFEPYSTSRLYIGEDSPYYSLAVSAGGRTVRANGNAMKGVVFEGGYAEFKAKLGRSNVDLFVLGDMLAAIETHVDEPDKGRIGIWNQTLASRAAAHQTGAGVPERAFFGLGLLKPEYDELVAIVRAKYVEAIAAALHGES